MNNEYYIKKNEKYVLNTYGRYPIAMNKGKKAYLWDMDNKKYLDFLSGLAVVNFGHCHPKINKAIKKQLSKLLHTSNLYHIPNQIKTAQLLSEVSFNGKTFFCNSGTEANESAIKFARIYGNTKKNGKNVILALHDSFHGRTTGSIKLTGQEKYQKGFEPLIEGVKYVTRNDIRSLQKQFNENVCAIFLEGIQGESGVHPLTNEFVNEVKKLCSNNDSLLIFDEVQTGIGRTGKYFSYMYFGITPDVITLAKGLGNGLPIGAMHVQEKHKNVFQPGNHASTFGGNPLCTAASVAVLELLKDAKTLNHVNDIANLLFTKLNELKNKFNSKITSIRGKGLMIAIEMPKIAKKVNLDLIEDGIITNAIGENILRILPPLIINKKDVDLFINRLSITIENN